MRISAKKRLYDRFCGPQGWHTWFAWYPVWVGDEYRWLERVERYLDSYYGNQYRAALKEADDE